MKKLVIPAAITLMMGVSTAARAEFAVYGLLDVCYGKSIADDAADLKADFHSGGDGGSTQCNSTSRFGLKGSLDVGGGVMAKFNLQSNGITSGGDVNDPFFGRQAWFGLAGGFGEFRLGRQESVPFQTMIDFDFNGASNGASNGVSAGWGPIGTGVGPYARGRQSATLNYISPSFSGATLQIGFDPKGNDSDKDVVSFGLKYANGPLAVAGTYQSKSASTIKDDFAAVAVSYDFGVAKIMGSYTDGGKIIEGGTGKGYQVGVTAPIAGVNVGAIFATNRDDVFTSKMKGYEFFVNKEVFKNTTAYFEVGNTKFSADGGEGIVDVKGTGFAVGVIYVF